MTELSSVRTSARPVPSLGDLVPRDTRVGDLAEPALVLPASTPALEVDLLLRADPHLRGVVVRDGGGYHLITRGRADDVLAGPFGYGRALLIRRDLRSLVAGDTLVVPAETPVSLVAREMLRRPEGARYDDAVVTRPDDTLAVAPVAAVLAHMAWLFQQMACHDPLTGLPNRLLLDQRVRHLPHWGAQSHRSRPAVLYVDLDRFKDVNDTLGHRAGDQVLVEFAHRLRTTLRPDDLVARLGGDEFAVVLASATPTEAQAIAERILLLASAPFVVNDAPVNVGASVGIAMAGDATEEGALTSLEVLLRHADAAMYRAKACGRGSVVRLQSVNGADDPTNRAVLLRHLRTAIDDGALSLHYQPKFTIPGGEFNEVEALLRWNDAELGQVNPADFIPIAERAGLIVAIGRWVLQTACAQARKWRQQGHDLAVAVNLSPVQLAAPGLVEDVLSILAAEGLPATQLRLEITESAAVQDVAATIAILGRLRDHGVRVSLDDFGTGYSSLSMLRELPLNGVKIDRSFIDQVANKPTDAALVKLVIEAAHALDLTVIAEGIETPEQLDAVTQLGCDAVQGFLLGRPVPAEALPLDKVRRRP
jgi:diguanylate cyclase (GGDEF)-like protein